MDQLGSTRALTTGSGPGQTPSQLCYDAEFTPYGQEISHTGRLQTTACPPNYKFTGYERDPETAYGATDSGLDYALARYYSSRLGRFLSTDPLRGSIGNLQSHNAFSYVVNNPLNLADPTGLTACRKDVPGVCPQGFSGVGGDLITTCFSQTEMDPADCLTGALAAQTDPLANSLLVPRPGPNGTMQIFLPRR